MKAHVPNTFRTATILSSEDVNGNLQGIARDIRRNQAARYCYFMVSVDITGWVDTDTEAQRTIPFLRPNTSLSTDFPIEVVGIDLQVYASSGATWTLTTTDENGTTATVAVDTVATTTEATASTNRPLQMDANDQLDLVLSASAASTITRGTVNIYCRADRHQQDGSTLTTYTPTLVDAATATSATAINAELTAAAAAVTSDGNNILDIRGCCLSSGGTTSAARTFRLPSGYAMDGLTAQCAIVATAAVTLTVTDGTNTVILTGTGTSNIVTDRMDLVTTTDDPTTTAQDIVVTWTPSAAVSRAFVFLYWS